MPNTVRLTGMVIAQGKQLADVQAGRLTQADYRAALAGIGVTAGWIGGEYQISFGGGIKDPSGTMLDATEVVEVVKMLIPAPHECAGAVLRVSGPMVGVAGIAIARVCYASDLLIDIVDRATGLVQSIAFPAEPRDQVRLVRPDTTEQHRVFQDGFMRCQTSQIWYKRRQSDPAFNVTGVLMSRIEKSPRTGKWQASLFDGRHFAWCEDLKQLEAV